MSDQTQSGVGTPDQGAGPQAANGLVPFFKKKGNPSPFSLSSMNRLVKSIRLLQSLQVQISDAEPNQDGSFTPSGKLTISDLNCILELFIAPTDASSGGGTANISPMQVVSYTTTNDYLSAKSGEFVSSGSFIPDGSAAVNVSLPWELRTGQSPGGDSPQIWPTYATNDIIYVLDTSPGDNGVFISSTELTLMDLGIGRNWAQRFVYNDPSTCATVHRIMVGGPQVAGA